MYNDKQQDVVSSIQILNYQNLILNTQNNIENISLSIQDINENVLKDLELRKKNLVDITLKDLELKKKNLIDIALKDLELQKKNLVDITLKDLNNQMKFSLAEKERKLIESMNVLKFQVSEANMKNSQLVGEYIMNDYPVKPKKKLIVVVAFVTGLILSIFLVFFMEFIKNGKNEEESQGSN